MSGNITGRLILEYATEYQKDPYYMRTIVKSITWDHLLSPNNFCHSAIKDV
jgi:hypothetical protein